ELIVMMVILLLGERQEERLALKLKEVAAAEALQRLRETKLTDRDRDMFKDRSKLVTALGEDKVKEIETAAAAPITDPGELQQLRTQEIGELANAARGNEEGLAAFKGQLSEDEI